MHDVPFLHRDPQRFSLPRPVGLLIRPILAFRFEVQVEIEQETDDHGADLGPGETGKGGF